MSAAKVFCPFCNRNFLAYTIRKAFEWSKMFELIVFSMSNIQILQSKNIESARLINNTKNLQKFAAGKSDVELIQLTRL